MSLLHKIGLTLIKGVGTVTAKNLLERFITAEAVFKAGYHQLLEVEGVGEVTARYILDTDALKNAASQLKFLQKYKIRILFYTDAGYPQRLKNCFDAPVLLYYKGTADLNHSRIISIVGTRKATSYGLSLCKQVAETLREYNVLVISGLAYGIDVAAHRESLSNGIPTVGILGHGLDRLYPAVHRDVAQEMLSRGGLLTEFPPGTVPDKENFPKRNRIIAGISDAVLVVEAAAKGGALITAEIAVSYNRDVFAFPGRTTDVYSAGCNFLIKTNRAALIGHTKDLAYYMGWEVESKPAEDRQTALQVGLSAQESSIVALLTCFNTLRVDELAIKANIPQSKLAFFLLNLEMKGIIISLPGKVYQLV
jgi:DNA processing protein